MKNSLSIQGFLSMLMLCFVLTGCVSFDKVGSDLGKGVKGQADSIGYNLANGLETRLTGAQTQEHVRHLLDSLSQQIVALRDSVMNDKVGIWLDNLIKTATGDSTKQRLASLRNELLGDATKDRVAAIRDELMGIATQAKLAALRDELVGANTNEKIQRILLEARDNILSNVTIERIGSLRDTLLGEKTKNMIAAIVDSAMLNISFRLRENINPALQDNASFIKKYATELLITLGVLAAGIVAFMWYSRRKYLKALTVLTSQIQTIPNQAIYDDLTARIKDNAVKSGVEPTLRKVLAENGFIGEENWEINKGKKIITS